jgi:GAF domain-containing protein
MDLLPPASELFYGVVGIGVSVVGLIGLLLSFRGRRKHQSLLRKLDRQKQCSDQVAQFVTSIGLSLAQETDFNSLLEKILLEAKSLAHADGGTLYLVRPDKTLQFAIVANDSLRIAMGGSSGHPISLPPLDLYEPGSGRPNHKNIAVSCALEAKPIWVDDVYAAQGFDFSGTREFDQRMNYRTVTVLCVPLKDAANAVIGVLQLINAQDPETKQIVPFDDHLRRTIGLLGLLAAAALRSYFRVRKLTDEMASLRIQIDEAKKERQVAEIAGSDYFKNLQSRAREMRSKLKGADKS